MREAKNPDNTRMNEYDHTRVVYRQEGYRSQRYWSIYSVILFNNRVKNFDT